MPTTSAMPVLLQIRGACKAFADQTLFEDIDFSLTDRMRVGLIGRNGAGKSTLCRAILGREELDAGEIIAGPDLRLGYLEQHDPWQLNETVSGFLQRHTEEPDWRCGEVAGRFGIGEATLAAELGALSGGWRTRVKLTALLLREPNLLVLDEPTNFLDLRTQFLLERFLSSWQGATIIISHDRRFLAAACTHTAELERGQLICSPRTIDDHLTWRAEEYDRLERENAAIQTRMDNLQRFIDSNRANANTASQARSKAKELERLRLHDLPTRLGSLRMRIPEVTIRDGTALRVTDLAIGYGEHAIASDISFELERGDHVAVVGDNGQGKTTLVRTLVGSLDGLHGAAQWTHGAEIGVYGQHVFDQLPAEASVLEHLTTAAAGESSAQEILAIAGSFLFRGDTVHKPISVLSGGECARLVMAALLLHRYTVLVLDEPTNHLDIDAVDALAAALQAYPGTVILVSHDRAFLSTVASDILEVDNGTIHHRPAGLEAWLEAASGEPATTATTSGGAPAPVVDKAARKALRREMHDLGKQVTSLERRMATQTARRDDALKSEQTADPDHLANLDQELEKLENQWLTAQERLEACADELDRLN